MGIWSWIGEASNGFVWHTWHSAFLVNWWTVYLSGVCFSDLSELTSSFMPILGCPHTSLEVLYTQLCLSGSAYNVLGTILFCSLLKVSLVLSLSHSQRYATAKILGIDLHTRQVLSCFHLHFWGGCEKIFLEQLKIRFCRVMVTALLHVQFFQEFQSPMDSIFSFCCWKLLIVVICSILLVTKTWVSGLVIHLLRTTYAKWCEE